MPEHQAKIRIEAGRKPTTEIAEEYSALIDRQLPEQRYQEFLEANTWFIPREFILNHGIHFDIVLRKLRMAADYTCDFFYLSKSSCEWNCVLIELEKPYSRYFKDGSDDFHDEFLKGVKQIKRWRAWFDDPANFQHFTDSTLAAIRIPPGMARNPCKMKYVLVTGRRSEFADSPRRRALIRQEETDSFSILSYDSLANSLRSRGEVYIGVRHNEYIAINSRDFISEQIFVWMPPEQLRITQDLKDEILRNKANWRYVSDPSEPEETKRKSLDSILPKIGII